MPELTLRVNGTERAVVGDAKRTLLSVLRDELGLTGAKYGCGEGQCGACTVLIGGAPRFACVTPVGTVGGDAIRTVEGLARGDQLHPIQRAFLDEGALQCGYCTCGMIMAAVALLERTPEPSAGEIVEFMDGNVCRCGSYNRIVSAIQAAARAMKEGGR